MSYVVERATGQMMELKIRTDSEALNQVAGGGLKSSPFWAFPKSSLELDIYLWEVC